MKKISAQIKNGIPVPLTEKDREEMKSYKENQIVTIEVKGTRKPRSYLALKTYWKLCQIVADNNNHEDWQTRDMVDFQLRVRLKLFEDDKIIVLKNKVIFELKSISFKNMAHLESCNYFNRCYDLINKLFGINVDEVIENYKITKQSERNNYES